MVSNWEILCRLGIAALLGGLVGLERQVRGRPAGLRTYLILSLGSALFMVLSEYLIFNYEGRIPGVSLNIDPGRIAAQAVTGIGFLGAGVIIRNQDAVRGLTTAACVWAVCAVGLSVGAGFYLYGAIVTVMMLGSLLGLKALERYLPRDRYQNMAIVAEDNVENLAAIQEIIHRHHFKIVDFGLRKDVMKQEMTLTLSLQIRSVRPERRVLQEVFELPGVKSVDLR